MLKLLKNDALSALAKGTLPATVTQAVVGQVVSQALGGTGTAPRLGYGASVVNILSATSGSHGTETRPVNLTVRVWRLIAY